MEIHEKDFNTWTERTKHSIWMNAAYKNMITRLGRVDDDEKPNRNVKC